MKKLISIISALCLIVLSLNLSIAVNAEEAEDSLSREADIISKLDIYNAEELDKPITLGEMLSALVNISGVQIGNAERVYYDIELTDPIAKNVTTAYHMGLISVPKDARLRPQRTVSYDETVRMAALVLGYGKLVDENYTAVLSRIKFTKRVNISDYSALTQGDAVQLLYKMLEEEVVECSPDLSVGGRGETVLESYLHMEKITGIVDKTSISSLTDDVVASKNKISIDGKMYPAPAVTDIEEYLGYRIEGYTRVNDADKTEFLYFGKYKNDVVRIDDINLESVSASKIEYSEKGQLRQAKLSGTEDIILNNAACPQFDLNLLSKDKFNGCIELIDNNSDNAFEVLKVYSYKNYTVKAYDGQFKITTEENKGTLDFSDYENVIFQKPDGTEPAAEDFAQNSLISVFDAGNNSYVKIIVNNKNAVGYVTGRDIKNNILFIDEDEYHTDAEFFATYENKIKNGKIFVLLDYRDKVGAISTEDSDFGLKWGYLCDIFKSEELFDDDKITVKIFDTEGKMNTLELYKKVYLDGVKQNAAKVYEYFSGTDISNGKQYCKRQFVRFTVNSNGFVTDLDSPEQTEFENDESNKSVTVEDKYTATDDLSFFAKTNYAIAKDVKIFVIPTDASGKPSDNRSFSDSDYLLLSQARTFVPFSTLTLKVELADIDKANIASLAAIEEVHDYDPNPGGASIEKYNKMRDYMVEDLALGLDDDGNVCTMLRYHSQRDNNIVQKVLADSPNVFMKPVYDENGKVVPGEYRPLKRGDIIRIKFDYANKKAVAVAVDFDIERTDNARFKQNTYFAIGVAAAKSGVGLKIAYKTLQGAPEFNGNNANEVFDFSECKISKISAVLANSYITVYDRKNDKIYVGGYNDLLDYNSSPDDLPIIVNRMRNNNELAIFVIK